MLSILQVSIIRNMKDPSEWTLGEKVKSYQKSLGKHGTSSKALQWRNEKSAHLRYEQLVADVYFENRSILDVGCGFGDIIDFIAKKTKKFEYTGVDIVPEFIDVAKKKYPKYKFVLRDYFSKPLKRKFDIVISSGALNSNMKDAESFRKKAIGVMFEHAEEALAFNMAGGHPQPENKRTNKVWYADSLEVLRYCMTLTTKVIFRNHYHKRDFTIILLK